MPTYDQIQRIALATHDTRFSMCEIADGKEQLGFRVRRAWNRKRVKRSKTCPQWKLEILRQIIHNLNELD